MPKLNPLMMAPPLIFAALAAMFYFGLRDDSGDDAASTFIGQPAPAITDQALADYPNVRPETLNAAQVTLVNFWASWCPPCRAEHPTLLALAADGIPIIGVNFNDREGDAVKYLTDDGNPFAAVAFDPNGRTSFDWGVSAPPETFILDADGTILFKFIGPLVGDDYRQRFLPELDKALGR